MIHAPSPQPYDRRRELARLVPADRAAFADRTSIGRLRIIARLAAALGAERERGAAGHWSAHRGRAANLRRALDAEIAALRMTAGIRRRFGRHRDGT